MPRSPQRVRRETCFTERYGLFKMALSKRYVRCGHDPPPHKASQRVRFVDLSCFFIFLSCFFVRTARHAAADVSILLVSITIAIFLLRNGFLASDMSSIWSLINDHNHRKD